MTEIEDHATAAIRLMENISNAPVSYRGHLFAQLQPIVEELLRSQKIANDAGNNDDLERKLNVFFRALSTYPSHQQEWLKVFKTFSELLIKELDIKPDSPAEAESKLMERLRKNHRFRFVEKNEN